MVFLVVHVGPIPGAPFILAVARASFWWARRGGRRAREARERERRRTGRRRGSRSSKTAARSGRACRRLSPPSAPPGHPGRPAIKRDLRSGAGGWRARRRSGHACARCGGEAAVREVGRGRGSASASRLFPSPRDAKRKPAPRPNLSHTPKLAGQGRQDHAERVVVGPKCIFDHRQGGGRARSAPSLRPSHLPADAPWPSLPPVGPGRLCHPWALAVFADRARGPPPRRMPLSAVREKPGTRLRGRGSSPGTSPAHPGHRPGGQARSAWPRPRPAPEQRRPTQRSDSPRSTCHAGAPALGTVG